MANGNGTVPIWLALVGFLLAAVSSLLSLLYRRDRGEHAALREQVNRLAGAAGTFDRFMAEQGVEHRVWQEQRIELMAEIRAVEKRLAELQASDAEWKHKIHAPRYHTLTLEIIRIKDKLGMPHSFDTGSGH